MAFLPALLVGCIAALGAGISASSTLANLDIALGTFTRDVATDFDRHASSALSALAATDVALPLTALAALVLCLLSRWRGALTLVAAVLSTQVVVDLMKAGFERPRPSAGAESAGGFSFPSAHSATAVALYATLAFVAASRLRGRARLAVVAAGVSLAAGVGLSRVVLAEHHPVDVLAGWLTGAAIALACWWLAGRIELSGPSQRPRLRWAVPFSRAQKGTP